MYVATYLGWRARYPIMVWRYGTVNGYTKTNLDFIIPYHLSFGTIQHLPFWVHILLVKIHCFNIDSYWLTQMTGHSNSFILALNKPPKFPFLSLFFQYIKTVVACRHDTLSNQQHTWNLCWNCIPCNGSLILEQSFPFRALFTDLNPHMSSVSV